MPPPRVSTLKKGETQNTKVSPQHQGTAFLHALRREPLFPLEREEKQFSRPPIFRLHCRPASSPLSSLRLMQRVAGAKAIPDARRADGAPQQARTSPRPQAGEGSRRCPTRHAADGVQPNSRDKFRVPAQRGVRGCRGCRGEFSPLTPCPAPGRRPAARAGQQPQDKEGKNF